jgi:hypothetical protein
MRFENSAVQGFRIDAVEFDNLCAAGEACYDPNRAGRHAGQFRQETEDCFVGFAIHRGRCDV